MDKKWLIWSIEHHGWWKPAERGYTHLREHAGKYSFEKAIQIVRGANIMLDDTPNESMVLYEEVDNKAKKR